MTDLTCPDCGAIATRVTEETEILEEYADGHVDVPNHPTRPPLRPARRSIAGPTSRLYEPCGHQVYV